ncbi:hypothetical protein JCM19241_5978 [Vibrio ishigakensis]|uniref:Uncharacterized protein n=1 Tax=Vibrio ishigakensis TaxID=1481914 RepID=A0A0B8QJ53_9VIBR|nr:hypothetical protein JCM19241_5978 [Vibrio ishigakensis]
MTLGHSRLKNYSAIAALAKSLKMKPQKLSRLLGELKLKIAKEYPELDAEMPDHMDTTALLKEHFSGSQIT